MERKINLYLVRHAESETNAALGKHEDDEDSGLTERGKSQALLLGQQWKHVKFHCVYSSDYRRSIETAELILEGCKENETESQPYIEISESLRELNFGTMTNASYYNKTLHYLKQMKTVTIGEINYPGGESLWGAAKRMLHFLERVCSPHLNPEQEPDSPPLLNVLVISHSTSLAGLLHYLSYGDTHPHQMTNWDPQTDVKKLKNACYYIFQINRNPEQEVDNGRFEWNIEALEKHTGFALDAETGDKEAAGEYSKITKLLFSSEEGKQIWNCCQQ